MKALITGAMGFIGSHWTEYLLEQGHTVYGLDLGPRYPALLQHDNFLFVEDTIKNDRIIERLVDNVDVVFHFAGIATPNQYVVSPRKVIDITANAGVKVVDACRLKGKLLFYTSTSEVYGKNPDTPLSEESDRLLGPPTTPRWCYATSKALVEHYIDACARARELDHITVRLFNVYGPRLTGRVVNTFMTRMMDGEDVIIHDKGRQTRSFTYVRDVMEAFHRLLDTPACRNQVFNVGNPVETSIMELAETMLTVGPFDSKLVCKPYDECFADGFEDIPRRVPNVDKLMSMTGWSPTTSLKDGLGLMYNYMNAER